MTVTATPSAWCELVFTGDGRLEVRFGGGRDAAFDFWSAKDDLKACVPAGCRKWDKETRTWLTQAIFGPRVQVWAHRWFDAGRIRVVRRDQHAESRGARDPRAGSPSREPRSSPHETLWILPGAPPELIKAAYRVLAALNHPDRGGDAEQMKRINLAYEALGKGAA